MKHVCELQETYTSKTVTGDILLQFDSERTAAQSIVLVIIILTILESIFYKNFKILILGYFIAEVSSENAENIAQVGGL